jgi:type IV secretory pathway component VirB8
MFDIFHTLFRYKEKESPDELGYYPVRIHTRAIPERRYLWTSRGMVIMACFSICLNMMLASTLYLLIPQRRVMPKLFQINQYFSQLEQVQPAELDYPVTDLVVEQHISEYILLRYIITNDYDEIRERWSPGSKIYWYSSPEIYKDFAENDVEYSIMQFRKKSLIRDVEIDWI